MYKEKKILAVIPARGGSKGVPKKNIYPLNGRPLIEYTADLVRDLTIVDKAVVSTDSEEIKKVANAVGLETPFTRPDHLSGDLVADWDVLIHALNYVEASDGCSYPIILILPPTCPFRKTEHVERAVEKLVSDSFDSVWAVSKTDSKGHPLKQFRVSDGRVTYYDEGGKHIIARQQLDDVYHINGAVFAMTRDCVVNKKSKAGDRIGAVVVADPLVNIDTPEDIMYAEFLLERGLIS